MASVSSQAAFLRRGLARSLQDGARFSPSSSSSSSLLRRSLSYRTRTQALARPAALSSCLRCAFLSSSSPASTAALASQGGARSTQGLRATLRKPSVKFHHGFSTTSASAQSTFTHSDRIRRMEQMQSEAYKKRNQSLMYYTAAVVSFNFAVFHSHSEVC